MRRRPAFDRRLLGGLTPATFLARHWQRRPLLVRGAFEDHAALPSRDDLFELAAREDVEARVVQRRRARWSLAHGPFERLPRERSDWTLLVQGVNLFDEAADALMRRFDFVSTMRLDDLMMSYAVDGGGVGPHLDSYDVFLVQVAGRRRWRWSAHAAGAAERALVPGLPIKQLAAFAPGDEAILEPGDLLYLPPSCAHEGVALGPCVTASVGFRAPSWSEMTQEFLFAMAERDGPDGRFGDAGRAATSTPGALDPVLLAAVTRRLSALRFTARDVETFVGRYFSEPKAHVVFDPPARSGLASFVRRARASGLALDLRATLLHRGTRLFIAGESFDAPTGTGALFRRLADRRRIDALHAARLCADPAAATLLHEWWQHGWIRYDEETTDGPP